MHLRTINACQWYIILVLDFMSVLDVPTLQLLATPTQKERKINSSDKTNVIEKFIGGNSTS